MICLAGKSAQNAPKTLRVRPAPPSAFAPSMRRSSFFVRFICIGVLFHIYVGFRVIPDLPIDTTGRWLAVLWLVLSCLLIPLGMVARTIKRQPLADRLAWIGLLGLGFFSSLLVLTFVRDLAMASLLTIDAIWPHAIPLTAWRMDSAAAVPLLALLSTTVGQSTIYRTHSTASPSSRSATSTLVRLSSAVTSTRSSMPSTASNLI
jgi:hypothetical protein